jgi:endonuclease YncB( thermonuclease family)
MALPIRAIPVLEGAAARCFLREAKKERGTVKFSEEDKASYRRIVADYKRNVLDKI